MVSNTEVVHIECPKKCQGFWGGVIPIEFVLLALLSQRAALVIESEIVVIDGFADSKNFHDWLQEPVHQWADAVGTIG